MPESGRGSKAGEGGEPKGGKEGGKEEGGSLKAQNSFLKFQAHFLSSKCTFTIKFWFWCSHFGVPNSQGRSHFVVFKDVLDNFPKDPRTMVSQHFHNDKGRRFHGYCGTLKCTPPTISAPFFLPTPNKIFSTTLCIHLANENRILPSPTTTLLFFTF